MHGQTFTAQPRALACSRVAIVRNICKPCIRMIVCVSGFYAFAESQSICMIVTELPEMSSQGRHSAQHPVSLAIPRTSCIQRLGVLGSAFLASHARAAAAI